MTLSRQQSVFTFSSSSGGEFYYFDIVVDAQSFVSARNIRSQFGPVDSYTDVPEFVLNDISDAKSIVVQLVAESQVATGTITFTGQTEQDVTLSAGLLNNTNYRVAYATVDDSVFTTTDKTITGFTANTPYAYGSVTTPLTVNYVVLASTQQSSSTSGVLTFVQSDNSLKSVSFAVPFKTNNYRVILSCNGFFTAQPVDLTKTGFDVSLGYSLGASETVTVGYDVFV